MLKAAFGALFLRPGLKRLLYGEGVLYVLTMLALGLLRYIHPGLSHTPVYVVFTAWVVLYAACEGILSKVYAPAPVVA